MKEVNESHIILVKVEDELIVVVKLWNIEGDKVIDSYMFHKEYTINKDVDFPELSRMSFTQDSFHILLEPTELYNYDSQDKI